ncbi:hypothetical protein ES703_106210 [subsurface metagenome]
MSEGLPAARPERNQVLLILYQRNRLPGRFPGGGVKLGEAHLMLHPLPVEVEAFFVKAQLFF